MRVLMRVPVVAAIVVVVLAATAVGAWAFLRDGETQTRGSCESAFYQLEVEPEDGGLELAFELTSTGPGESWDVVIEQNGEVLFEVQRSTDEDGEIDVDVPVRSGGDDEFTATATSPDGQTCTASLRHG